MTYTSEIDGNEGALLFVYGTLKKGGRLNHHMVDIGAIRVDPEFYLYGYTMVNTGWFPAIYLSGKNENYCAVLGELWAVPNEGFKVLDEVEGVRGGLFRRILEVNQSPDGSCPPFYVYTSNRFMTIESPDLKNEKGIYEWPVK
jgi:gamma-glutamylcyclotransferase (GGCT)/AIG2-like uncharacterized protein YtfP